MAAGPWCLGCGAGRAARAAVTVAVAGLRSFGPHALRHGGITLALDITGNLAAVAKFARHRNPRTTMIYADNLADEAGKVARATAAAVAAGSAS